MRKKITAIIPTFNEEKNIEKAIQSVLFADEIMIVDSYSADKTLEIARKYTKFILQREYQYSASQKNWAIPQAKNEWILLLDADEIVTPELKEEIEKILDSEPEESAFRVYRQNYFMGKKMNHSGLNTDKVMRLFKRDENRYEDKYVHATLLSDGITGTLKHKIIHNTYDSFDEHIEKINRYAWWSAKDHINKNSNPNLYHFMVKPVWSFFWHYIVRGGFLDGIPGLVYSFTIMYGVFTRYVKIWMLKKGKV